MSRRRTSLAARLLALPVRGYRVAISPLLPPSCRHLPSCSEYALTALEQHGALRGAWLAAKRLARCHPWGSHGFDPVPPPTSSASTSPSSPSSSP